MPKATRSTEGHVYFLHAPEVGRVKIGFTIGLESRLNELRLGSPVKLHLLKTIRCTLAVEIALLAVWHRYRLHGEWFEAAPALLRFIKRLKNDGVYTAEKFLEK